MHGGAVGWLVWRAQSVCSVGAFPAYLGDSGGTGGKAGPQRKGGERSVQSPFPCSSPPQPPAEMQRYLVHTPCSPASTHLGSWRRGLESG